MTESELEKYLRKRCSETSFETPDFDSFFTEKELSAAVGKAAPKVPVRKLWPWMATASAAAVAAALLWLAPFNHHPDTQDSLADQVNKDVEVVPDQEGADETAENLALSSLAGQSSLEKEESSVLNSENAPSHQTSKPQSVTVSHVAVPVVSSAASAEESAPIQVRQEESEPAARDEAEPELEPQGVVSNGEEPVSEPLTYYERTVEEAYAEARAQRKGSPRRQFQGTTVSLAFNQDNSIRQGTPNAQSPVSMITRTYASGMGLRSASVSRNEWLQPTIFQSQIAEYKPVYDLPLVLSLSASIPIGRCFDLHTGLTYTYLSANTQGKLENESQFSIDQSLHYVGIPLSLALNILETPRFGLYMAAGGGIEKGLLGTQFIHVKSRSGENEYERLHQPVHGFQPYLSAQLGLSYSISEMMQFFIEPGISYYLEADQPLSVRTRQPFYYGLGFGVRLLTR